MNLKEFVSDFSLKRVKGKSFDDIFQVEGVPLSWIYRPILYSGLLPHPFPSISDVENGHVPGMKLRLFIPMFMMYLTFTDIVKRE